MVLRVKEGELDSFTRRRQLDSRTGKTPLQKGRDSKELRDRKTECQGRGGYSLVFPHKMRGVVSSLDPRSLGGDLRSAIRTLG